MIKWSKPTGIRLIHIGIDTRWSHDKNSMHLFPLVICHFFSPNLFMVGRKNFIWNVPTVITYHEWKNTLSLLFGILFAIIFDLPPPIEHMPIPYLNKIENSVIVVVEASMQGAADELHLRLDSVPSVVPSCINVAVSSDSSWKTWGFYSNMGFGSAISANIRKEGFGLCAMAEKP